MNILNDVWLRKFVLVSQGLFRQNNISFYDRELEYDIHLVSGIKVS